MAEIFLRLIEEFEGTTVVINLFILICVIVIVMWLLYKLGAWVQLHSSHEKRLGNVEKQSGKVEGRLGKVESRLDKVEDSLGKVESRLDKLEDKVDILDTDVKVLSTKIDLIYQFLNAKTPVGPNSPLKLREVGVEISKKIHAEEIFNRVKSEFIDEFVHKNKNNNAFEIQQNSMDWAKRELKKYMTKEEITAFDNEAYERGFLPEYIYAIVGIYLRDYVLDNVGMNNKEPAQQKS